MVETQVSRQIAPELPADLHDQVRVNWYMTQWCNYSCPYCPVLVFHKRTTSGERQPHAFDFYPVEKWLELFDKLPQPQIELHITGGEPFLDRRNLRALLEGLAERRRFRTCISTNGAWDPAYFEGLDKSSVFLDIGFHPTQTNLETLLKQVRRIRDAGFEVAVVNYVVSPENMDTFDEVFQRLSEDGQYVQVSPMFPTGEHLSRDYRTDRELEILVRHNTPLDLHYKIIWPPMNKRLCFYPALNYSLLWDGGVQISCMDGTQNAFEKGFPALPRRAVACPRHSCIGCAEMYRNLVDEPLYPKPPRIFTHKDLAAEVSEYRRTVRAGMSRERIREEVQQLQSSLADLRKQNFAQMPLVPVDAIKPALPEGQTVMGYLDALDSKFFIEARSRDRIMVTGWMTSIKNGAPLRDVNLSIDGKRVATVHEFYPRPDVATHFARESWLMSGWRTMIYLPTLATGEHSLVVEGTDFEGRSGALPPWSLRIKE